MNSADIRRHINLVEKADRQWRHSHYRRPPKEEEDDPVWWKLSDSIVPKIIGSGRDRTVYATKDPNIVVKEENGRSIGGYQNFAEHAAWQELADQGAEIAKYFAPCHEISTDGHLMSQTRVVPLDAGAPDPSDPVPLMLAFMDPQEINMGRLNGQLVMHDYGHHTLTQEYGLDGGESMFWMLGDARLTELVPFNELFAAAREHDWEVWPPHDDEDDGDAADQLSFDFDGTDAPPSRGS